MVRRGADREGRDEVMRPAVASALTLLLAMLAVIALGLFGVALLVVFLLRANAGGLVRGFAVGSPNGAHLRRDLRSDRFVCRVIARLGPVQRISRHGDFRGVFDVRQLARSLLARVCGVPWKQVRSDIGWTAGRNGWLELLWGVVAYIMTIPWLAVGLLLTILLMLIQRRFGVDAAAIDPFYAPPTSSHPILVPLSQGNFWDRLGIFFLASIAAPIVEETMFLRRFFATCAKRLEPGGCSRVSYSSALVSSVIFAAAHPQG
ncbi:MAG: hypothetical protein U0744_03730 [Gemmataceae bacterium]